MHAKQYELRLPADYDMAIIRHRVATRGHLTDAYDGLGLKAYLIRERGHDGSPVNEYAPFYLWAAAGGMNRFRWGAGGFRGIIDDFGRPPVRRWVGAAFEQGPARDATPRAAFPAAARPNHATHAGGQRDGGTGGRMSGPDRGVRRQQERSHRSAC